MSNEKEIREVLEQAYAIGLEKYAGDESKAIEFVQGFAKEAATLPGFMSQVAKGAAGAIGAGVVGAGLGLGMHGLSSAMAGVQNSNMHSKFVQVLEQVKSRSALLKNAPQEKIRSYAETIFKFAPHVATDPNLLTAILSNAVHGEGVDPMTIKTLTDLENQYIKAKSGALFNPGIKR